MKCVQTSPWPVDDGFGWIIVQGMSDISRYSIPRSVLLLICQWLHLPTSVSGLNWLPMNLPPTNIDRIYHNIKLLRLSFFSKFMSCIWPKHFKPMPYLHVPSYPPTPNLVCQGFDLDKSGHSAGRRIHSSIVENVKESDSGPSRKH